MTTLLTKMHQESPYPACHSPRVRLQLRQALCPGEKAWAATRDSDKSAMF